MRFNLLKPLLLGGLSLLLTSAIRAQTNLDSALLKKIDSTVTKLSSSVDSLRDSVRVRWDSAVASSFSSSLDSAMRHPKTLYAHPFEEHRVISIVAFIFLAFFLIKFFQYFFTSGLSRDESYDQNWKLKPVKDRTFSYGRVQLCWWTLIILFCFIWFYAVFGVLLPLNSTVVLLLGSGLAVFIFGKTIDKSQIDKDNKKPGDQPLRHQDVENSRGFLTDILSDDTGISIHRLQAVAFNVIYGIGFLGYFFTSIGDRVHLPRYPFISFEPWQLSLLGISSAGYLGMKVSENDKSTKEDRKEIAEAQQKVDAVVPPDPDAVKDPSRPKVPDTAVTPTPPAEEPATRNREDAE